MDGLVASGVSVENDPQRTATQPKSRTAQVLTWSPLSGMLRAFRTAATLTGTRSLKRRDFITLLGGAAAWPLAARAQQPAMPVIGFMHSQSPETASDYAAAFQQGLKEAGFVEGQNVTVEYHWAQGYYDRLSGIAADLVRRKVDIIAATGGEPSPQVAKAATQTIPIVFTTNGDPVKEGLVASLNRPGGNATGATIFGEAAVTKRLQLLHEVVPQAAVIGFLMNPNHPNSNTEMKVAETAARSLRKEMLFFNASNESELDAAFANMARQQVGALLGGSDTFFAQRRDQIASLAAHYRIPAMYYVREFAHAGGLMAYGNRVADMYRLVGIYVGRILKGEKPGDLPVQESTKFELVINLKTAKALRIEIPILMQLLADEVIE
jgi:putative tryptophan/tyrosine transport system substrate-binding protein